ncbi:MAG: fumarylacetoacetate hydrolase family protein [Chromatiales bacterium]|nr:fumarylacetoacetate hydrolase family protein [Chromatiales bacterium]
MTRVFCIGRNYAEHTSELGNVVPDSPVVFMKPASALVEAGSSVPFPTHGQDLQHEVEIVVRIASAGRDIPQSGAMNHLDAVTVGIDLTLRDVQSGLKARGLPWEPAKAFENSAPIGDFVPLGTGLDCRAMEFACSVDGEIRQQGDTADMIFPIPVLVAHLSSIWTLQPGDLIFTGTPAGVGSLRPGDLLMASAQGVGEFQWRITD